jgi:hypothetical protein
MIGSREFREAIRTVDVSYPIPFILTVLLAFAVVCFGLAVAASELLRWLFVAFGGMAALVAFGLAAFAVLARPGLLRSERHSLVTRYLELLGDSDMDTPARDSAERAVLRYIGSGTEGTKRQAAGEPGATGDDVG